MTVVVAQNRTTGSAMRGLRFHIRVLWVVVVLLQRWL